MKEIPSEYRKALEYVARNESVLRRAYTNESFIAVLGEVVVGSDTNEFELARKIEDKFRRDAVYIGTIDGILSDVPVWIEESKP